VGTLSWLGATTRLGSSPDELFSEFVVAGGGSVGSVTSSSMPASTASRSLIHCGNQTRHTAGQPMTLSSS
jgi:hypothetical protein